MIPNVLSSRFLFTLSWTADGSIIVEIPPHPIQSMVFTSDGADGGGTLSWFVSNDNSQFDALGVSTAADPVFATPVTSATGAGNWTIHQHDTAYRYFKFTLASSTNPTLTVTINGSMLR
jgi:hypothetical protein